MSTTKVVVGIRTKQRPRIVQNVPGHLPFTVHGELFAVTRNPDRRYTLTKWRVSHVQTGAAVPLVYGRTKKEARTIAKAKLRTVAKAKLRAEVARVRAFIATNKHQS